MGCSVVGVGTGAEALELLKVDRFDLPVSDVVMPGMNGDELIEQVDLPVLLISGYAAPLLGKELSVPFLAKPFTQKQLVTQLVELAAAPRPAPRDQSDRGRPASGCARRPS